MSNRISVRDGIEDFLCPFTDMYITQGSNGNYSHQGIMAHDVRGETGGVRYPYFAPCFCRVYQIYPESGQAMWESVDKVRFANGRIDYATFCTCHDDTFDAYVGMERRQGEQIGNMGTKGYATGVHCHIEISQSNDKSWYKNEYGNYHFNNEYDPSDCYFVDYTNIIDGNGLNFKKTSDVPIINITPNVEKNENKNQIEVIVSELRVRTTPSINGTILGYASIGYYNYYEVVVSDGYTWYKIDENNYIAYNEEWEILHPKVEYVSFKVLDSDGEYKKIDLSEVYIK